MIESIYIMNENGVLLYQQNLTEENYDSNLLLGFFSSITHFSREALNSIIKYLDLGANRKLIILPMSREGLLGAMIASSKDDNNLLNQILRNFMLDFIDEYSPTYELEKIDNALMEILLNNNVKGKIQQSPIKRVAISWLIVAPMSYFLLFISILATEFLYNFFELDQLLFSQTEIFTVFMPSLVFLAISNVFIIFILPNFILGFLIGELKLSYGSSIILVIIVITLYFLSAEPLFAYIIIANLPLAFLVSFAFCYIGMKLSSRKFLTSE